MSRIGSGVQVYSCSTVSTLPGIDCSALSRTPLVCDCVESALDVLPH